VEDDGGTRVPLKVVSKRSRMRLSRLRISHLDHLPWMPSATGTFGVNTIDYHLKTAGSQSADTATPLAMRDARATQASTSLMTTTYPPILMS